MANWGKLREPRLGVMLHYDASASDPGAVAWLTRDPRCRVSYNWLVLDNGAAVEVAPAGMRAWHAGVCRPSRADLPYRDANSAFYGIAVAAKAGDTVTPAQLARLLELCRQCFARHRWVEPWRLVGHHEECWPRGRKVDPLGPDPRRPVLDLPALRRAL